MIIDWSLWKVIKKIKKTHAPRSCLIFKGIHMQMPLNILCKWQKFGGWIIDNWSARELQLHPVVHKRREISNLGVFQGFTFIRISLRLFLLTSNTSVCIYFHLKKKQWDQMKELLVIGVGIMTEFENIGWSRWTMIENIIKKEVDDLESDTVWGQDKVVLIAPNSLLLKIQCVTGIPRVIRHLFRQLYTYLRIPTSTINVGPGLLILKLYWLK